MPDDKTKKLKYHEAQTTTRELFEIYAGFENMLEITRGCKNSLES